MDYIVAIDWRSNYGGFCYLYLETDDLIEAKEKAIGIAARYATKSGETTGQGIDKIYYIRLLSQTKEQEAKNEAIDTGLSFSYIRFEWKRDDAVGEKWSGIHAI